MSDDDITLPQRPPPAPTPQTRVWRVAGSPGPMPRRGWPTGPGVEIVRTDVDPERGSFVDYKVPPAPSAESPDHTAAMQMALNALEAAYNSRLHNGTHVVDVLGRAIFATRAALAKEPKC